MKFAFSSPWEQERNKSDVTGHSRAELISKGHPSGTGDRDQSVRNRQPRQSVQRSSGLVSAQAQSSGCLLKGTSIYSSNIAYSTAEPWMGLDCVLKLGKCLNSAQTSLNFTELNGKAAVGVR